MFEELCTLFEADPVTFRVHVSALPLQHVVKLGEQAFAEKKWMVCNFLFMEASMKMAKLAMYAIDEEKKRLGIE